ncbi:MAG: L-2-amino-thiazoline-4-carboxylic acid hydrolase [Candidatus Lokiarchaeota archaeon]|nr:L-2-amino-thiazoline-4-carboxylic acid hydrolase [Candidatus Lokiarchaeota archaeon]
MKKVSQDDKLFFFERNFFTLDGLWMIETEEMTNWETALKIDVIVWKKLLNIVIRRLKKYLQLEKNDLRNLIDILTFRWSIEGWEYKVLKSEDGKVKIVVDQCPYQAAMSRNPERTEKQPLICKEMCIPFYKSVVENYNENIILNRTAFMGLGDSSCDFSLSFEDKTLDKAEQGGIPEEIRKIKKEDKLFYFEKNFRTLDGLWVIKTERELGWDAALKLDISVWQKLYIIIFRRVIKYLNIKGNTLEDLVNVLSFIWNCEGNIHNIFQEGDNQATISIIECPYIAAMERNPERHNRIESICKDMCISYLQPVIKEFNPKIEVERDKFMGLGDSECNIILKLKD